MRITKRFTNYFKIGSMEILPRLYFSYPMGVYGGWEISLAWLWFDYSINLIKDR